MPEARSAWSGLFSDSRFVRWPPPRFSLRLLLIVMTALSMFVALHRERLRDRAEVAWVRFQELLGADSQSTRGDHIVILGPIQPVGAPPLLDLPSPEEIVAALQKSERVNNLGPNVRMVIEPIAAYLDPPRVYPLIGPAQLHHAHYKCMIYSDNGARSIYVDRNHFCLP